MLLAISPTKRGVGMNQVSLIGNLTRDPELRPLPLDAVTRTFGIFGQRGTGKSTTGAVLVEQGVHAAAARSCSTRPACGTA
jgi:hypothetical protein